MEYRVLSGLTATLLGAYMQSPQLCLAEAIENQSFNQSLDLLCQVNEFSIADSSTIPTPYPAEGPLEQTASLEPWALSSAGQISTFSHIRAGHQAITVYIRSIPILTFIGTEQSEPVQPNPSPSNSLTITDTALIDRVKATATQLEAFRLSNSSASQIAVRWDAHQEDFVISLAEQDLVTIDETTILPNTLQDPALDALQITNRLRYLLGDAPPLETIAGLPRPAPRPAAAPTIAMTLTGVASWYGPGFHGRRSASGEIFNQRAMTAAHRHLPFGTRVRVTNLHNGRQVVVRINDRGPFIHGRIIDLSTGAADTLGMLHSGVAQVKIEVFNN